MPTLSRYSVISSFISATMLVMSAAGLSGIGGEIRTITALCFMMGSVMLAMICIHRTPFTQFIVSMISFSLLLAIAVTVTAAAITAAPVVQPGVSLYFDLQGLPRAGNTHYPSLGSVFGFSMIAASGLIYLFNTRRMYRRIRCAGIAVLAIGALPFIHSVTGWPHADYAVGWWYAGNGMSIYTATLFILYGVGLRFAIKTINQLEHHEQ